MQQRDSSPSQSYFWPTVLAVGLHIIIFGMLFVSFSMTPELPPSKPICARRIRAPMPAPPSAC